MSGGAVWLSGLHCCLRALNAWTQLPAQWPFLCVLLNFPLDSPDFNQSMLGEIPASHNPKDECG